MPFRQVNSPIAFISTMSEAELYWIIGIATVLAVIVAIRFWLAAQAKIFCDRIGAQTLFCDDQSKNRNAFISLESDLEKSFYNQFIRANDEKRFIDHYATIASEAKVLQRRLEFFSLKNPKVITNFLADFDRLHSSVRTHNETFIQAILATNKDFFDHCLKYPLDEQQRRAIVSEENNCLVVSSAGSGKTSSIVGKVKYLTEVKKIPPERILLISYTNKAAAELTERLGVAGLKGYTFHKLAMDLIGKATGQKPSICDKTDAVFLKLYHELLNERDFKRHVVEYLIDRQSLLTDNEKKEREYRQRLSELKQDRLKADFPDMDGNVIYVRSEQERKICLALSLLSVKFRYEEPYEHQVADEMHSQYRPDFSIYFEKEGQIKRIYLEHFGINEKGLVPVWFARDKGISYEEANRKYNDGITWKRALHEKFHTVLLTTSSADFLYSDIKNKLKQLLQNAGVPIEEKGEEQLYELFLPRDSIEEKTFIRLVISFITLLKTSCKTLDEVINEVKKAHDTQSLFAIKYIFKPVYERYTKALQSKNEIDFTDVILKATDICNASHPVQYDYIIVDEFQDISVDRYQFLNALRSSSVPAKLFCVGDDWQSIYRFSGSDMSLFNQFSDYFGPTEIDKIETTYRFGEPLVSLSSEFIQRNQAQIKKAIHPFNANVNTQLVFQSYDKFTYRDLIEELVSKVPANQSLFLLGRYSFDDYHLSLHFKSIKEGGRFYYLINGRKIEFLTIHKSKGLEADYVIVLQCNKDRYGFPSLLSDDWILNYVLTKSDKYPYAEERRIFYVAITRAKVKTYVLYHKSTPSVFIDEFLHPKKTTKPKVNLYVNRMKPWTLGEERFLLKLYEEGKSTNEIAFKLKRTPMAIVMRLGEIQSRGFKKRYRARY